MLINIHTIIINYIYYTQRVIIDNPLLYYLKECLKNNNPKWNWVVLPKGYHTCSTYHLKIFVYILYIIVVMIDGHLSISDVAESLAPRYVIHCALNSVGSYNNTHNLFCESSDKRGEDILQVSACEKRNFHVFFVSLLLTESGDFTVWELWYEIIQKFWFYRFKVELAHFSYQNYYLTKKMIISKASKYDMPSHTRLNQRWHLLLVLGVSLLVFSNHLTLHGKFVYDDKATIQFNPIVQGMKPISDVWVYDYW